MVRTFSKQGSQLLYIEDARPIGMLELACTGMWSFPQFIVIHTVKGFSEVSGIEVDAFVEFVCFLYDPVNVGNLIRGSSAFLNPV